MSTSPAALDPAAKFVSLRVAAVITIIRRLGAVAGPMRRQAAVSYVRRASFDSWEIVRNPLKLQGRFCPRLGKNHSYFNAGQRTLTPLILVRIQVPQPIEIVGLSAAGVERSAEAAAASIMASGPQHMTMRGISHPRIFSTPSHGSESRGSPKSAQTSQSCPAISPPQYIPTDACCWNSSASRM
jgi:hypothetical protein